MVAVADRTPVFLHGLVDVLATDGVEVVPASSVSEVRDLIGKSPDALVIDLRMATEDHSLCAVARAEGIPLVVTVPRETDGVLDLVEEGVNGLWDRDGDIIDLRRTVSGALMGGTTVISANVGRALAERIAAARASGRSTAGRLTNREHEILSLMAHGAGNRAIADTLFISENTVRNHVRNVLDKLHAASRTEAVVRAVKAGLIRLG